MKKSKKIIVISTVILLLVFSIIPIIFKKEENNIELLNDGDVYTETFDTLDGWKIYDYEKLKNGKDVTEVILSEEGYNNKAILISGDEENDVRIYKKIKVKPDSYYKVSIMIKNGVEHVKEEKRKSLGASISSLKSFNSYKTQDAYGEWKKHEIYITTDEEQEEIDFCLGIGDYLYKVKGYVYYDDLKIEKVDNIPEGTFKVTFFENLDGITNLIENSNYVIENDNYYEEKYDFLNLNETQIKLCYLLVITFVVIILKFIYKNLIKKN